MTAVDSAGRGTGTWAALRCQCQCLVDTRSHCLRTCHTHVHRVTQLILGLARPLYCHCSVLRSAWQNTKPNRQRIFINKNGLKQTVSTLLINCRFDNRCAHNKINYQILFSKVIIISKIVLWQDVLTGTQPTVHNVKIE